jgi:hypothetical protein
MTRNTIRQCRACPTWTAPDRARRQDPNLRARYAEHVARGLCRACYEQANRAGTLEDYPRGTWARDELLDEWDRLRAVGVSVVDAAPRLGMTVAALARALERARKAGDPRARFTWAGVQTATRQRAA